MKLFKSKLIGRNSSRTRVQVLAIARDDCRFSLIVLLAQHLGDIRPSLAIKATIHYVDKSEDNINRQLVVIMQIVVGNGLRV
jgi:hypothetical protein